MLICGGIYPKGNPGESQLLGAELKQLTAKGRVIKSVSLDRGYWDRTKLEEIEKASGTQMYCPKKGKKNAERAALEGSEEFRRQQQFRVGIEGTLSVLGGLGSPFDSAANPPVLKSVRIRLGSEFSMAGASFLIKEALRS